MKATVSQAENNERNLSVTKTGYGHWRIEMDYRGKRISTVTTDSIAVDNFNSEFGEKTESFKRNGKTIIRPCNRRLSGYISLCEKILNNN